MCAAGSPRSDGAPLDEIDRRHRLPLAADARLPGQRRRPGAQHLGLPERLWREHAALVREFKPDVVIASSTYPMDIWVARRIARRAARSWCYEVHDLWPLSPIELSGMSPRHPFVAAVPEGRERCLPRCRRRRVDAAEGRRPHGRRTASTCASCTSCRTASRRTNGPGDVGAARRRARRAPRRAARARPARWSATPARTGCRTRSTCCWTRRRCCATSRSLRAGRRRPREARACAQRVRDEGLANVAMFAPIPKAQIPALLRRIRHRLHRLAAGADLPLRHRAEQADGLHDGAAARCCIRSRPATIRWPRPAAASTVPPESPRAVADGLRSAGGAARRPSARRWASAGGKFVLANQHVSGAGAALLERCDERRGQGRPTPELASDVERYAWRGRRDPRYSMLDPDVWMTLQERQRVVLRRLGGTGIGSVQRPLLEVGCGEGDLRRSCGWASRPSG